MSEPFNISNVTAYFSLTVWLLMMLCKLDIHLKYCSTVIWLHICWNSEVGVVRASRPKIFINLTTNEVHLG
jgi:hypothetical protein